VLVGKRVEGVSLGLSSTFWRKSVLNTEGFFKYLTTKESYTKGYELQRLTFDIA